MQRIVQLLFMLQLSILLSQPVNAQQSAFSGTVLTSDGNPATGVSIQVAGTSHSTVTGETGHFRFTGLTAGAYQLIITYIGHQAKQQPIQVLDGKEEPLIIRLNVSQQELREVVVNGNLKSYISEQPSASLRLNAPLLEIPQSITVATKQSLQDMGLLSKTEIYRLSSGITKSFGGAMDMTVQIRGTNATYNTYRNGIGGPIWWNAQEDAAMVERLEFVKGPAGFMLSNAEPGGLINTVTKQPTHQRIAEVNFGVGSYNMMRTNIDLGGEFVENGKLTFRLNAGFQRNNEFYQFGKFQRFFVAPALKYEFSDRTSITIETNYVNAKAQENTHTMVSANGDLWANPIKLAINDPHQKPWGAADLYNRVHLKHQFNSDWTLQIQGGYMTTKWGGTSLSVEGINATRDTINRYMNYNDWDGNLYNLQLFMDGKFMTGKYAEHKVLFGLDYGDGMEGNTNGNTWGTQNFPLSIKEPTYYLPKDELKYTGDTYTWLATNRWTGIYVQDHLKLFNKVVLTLAGRFTRLTTGQDFNAPPDDPDYEISENKFTPRLGLTYLFTENLSAYMLHDESFLAQRGAIYGGGRLPPMTGRNNEVGVKGLFFNKQLSVSAAVFNIIKNNVGNSDPLHPGYYLQTGQVQSKGMDVDVAGKVGKHLYINANYSYVDAKISKDKDASLIGLQNNGTARNIANGWIKYQLTEGVVKGLGIGAGIQYTDKRSGIWPGYNNQDGNKYLPAYTIFDAALSYNTGRFRINLNVYNLGNKKYATSGNWQSELQEWLFDIERPLNFRLQTSIRL